MFILKSSQWAISYLPLSVVFLFTGLVFLNATAKSLLKVRGLGTSELGLIFTMSLVGASIPTWGTSTYMIAVVAAPQYFASPENQWQSKVLQYIEEWLVPNDAIALKWFYNGLPAGESIPWGAWIGPFFWWTSLVMAIFFLCQCLVAALRKQWVEYERLPFALMELPQQLIAPPPGSNWPSFVRQKAFWFGFALPFCMVMWNVVTYFTPAFPPIPRDLSDPIRIGREFPAINTNINWAIVGFTYFVNLDVSFSMWFFTTLTMLQEGLFNRFGYTIAGRDVYTLGHPGIGWQSFGALIALVVGMLWMARGHLGAIWAQSRAQRCGHRRLRRADVLPDDRLWRRAGPALHRLLDVAGRHEPAHGRALHLGHLGPLHRHYAHHHGRRLALQPRTASRPNLRRLRTRAARYRAEQHRHGTVLRLAPRTQGLFHGRRSQQRQGVRPHPRQPPLAELLHPPLGAGGPRRLHGLRALHGLLLWRVQYGGWIFGTGSQVPYVESLRKIDLKAPDWTRLGHLVSGAGAMGLLTFMRYRFPWWPLHPIGMPVGICSYPMTIIVFSIFVSWLAKWAIMRSGGIGLYQHAQPFFIGLILGYFTGIGLSFCIDMIWFPGQGHPLYGN